jgi:hypothetical protein
MSTSESAKLSEVYPDGRELYYEGNDFIGFAAEVKAKTGFDPSQHWRVRCISFHCPAEYLEEVYGSGRWPLGT